MLGARIRARTSVLLLFALLAACATATRPPPERSYTGRFSATTVSGEQRESVSGRFTLEVRGRDQLLELASPLGTIVARIEVTSDGARATAGEMREARGPDADALTEQLLGWRLPVSGLPDWIEGRPVPDRAASVERDSGRVVAIEQDGWAIRVQETFGTDSRPRRLLLERPKAAGAPAITLRLIVDEPG